MLIASQSAWGFTTSGGMAAHEWFNEAETGSRFRITADAFAFQGFKRSDYSTTCSVGYMANEHLPWLVPFN